MGKPLPTPPNNGVRYISKGWPGDLLEHPAADEQPYKDQIEIRKWAIEQASNEFDRGKDNSVRIVEIADRYVRFVLSLDQKETPDAEQQPETR